MDFLAGFSLYKRLSVAKETHRLSAGGRLFLRCKIFQAGGVRLSLLRAGLPGPAFNLVAGPVPGRVGRAGDSKQRLSMRKA